MTSKRVIGATGGSALSTIASYTSERHPEVEWLRFLRSDWDEEISIIFPKFKARRSTMVICNLPCPLPEWSLRLEMGPTWDFKNSQILRGQKWRQNDTYLFQAEGLGWELRFWKIYPSYILQYFQQEINDARSQQGRFASIFWSDHQDLPRNLCLVLVV